MRMILYDTHVYLEETNMLLDKINIIGYILQMVKYIFTHSNHDSYLIVSPDNVHPLWYSDNESVT